MSKKSNEIQNMNIDDLDVEELESRLELAIFGIGSDDAAGCNGINYGCGTNYGPKEPGPKTPA